MTATAVLWLLLLLQWKHLLADFVFQPAWMYKNKGTFLHPGGLVHAACHALPTGLALAWFSPSPMELTFMIMGMEFVVHYVVDWAKMNLNGVMGWTPINSENFWRLLGIDQFAHQFTYIVIVWVVCQ